MEKTAGFLLLTFVLMDYGSGQHLVASAYDQKILILVKKYNLEIKQVVSDGEKIELKEVLLDKEK